MIPVYPSTVWKIKKRKRGYYLASKLYKIILLFKSDEKKMDKSAYSSN